MARINYANIISKYRNIGKGAVRLTQSSLYLTKPIVATQTTYTFDILETQTATQQADEIRLNLNDEFICSALGLYLEGDLLSGMGVVTGIKRLFTYAPVELNGATNSVVENFYNGQFQISVNNIVFLDKWDTRKHEFIPQTQFANFTAGTNTATQSQQQMSKAGMFPVEPTLTLSGAKKNQLTLALPTAISPTTVTFTDDAAGSVSYRINRVACLMRGLNAQNGATFQS
jgi:hypothetical protein